MSKVITQEVAIVIAVPVENPTILNVDFLKQAGIIPIDWQLEREPVYSDHVAQIMFTNGLSIVAQPDRLMFLELVGDKSIKALHASEVAQKYIATFKMADYRSVGLNFRSYAEQNSPDAATAYINNKLLSGGSWQKYNQHSKMHASINLNYNLGDQQLNLSIDAATIQFPIPLVHPAVVFSGTFSYGISLESGETATKIAAIIGNWQQELTEFNSFIADRLLPATSDRQDRLNCVVDDIKIVDAPGLAPLFSLN
jgi:hypothetical protein